MTSMIANENGKPASPGVMPVELFGLPFAPLNFDQTLDAIVSLAQDESASYVVTANVDHVVRVRRRPELMPLYSGADLVVADGMPLIWASKLLGKPLPERVAGSDLFPALCGRAADCGLSVFLFGGAPGTADRAAEVMQGRYPQLRLAGTYCPDYGFEHDADKSQEAVDAVRASQPDLLFVGLGSPKQEQWILQHKDVCGARCSIGVGISFSFACGEVHRAPRWMQRIGLEWFHRLCQEPGRLWKRYLVDDSYFATLVLREFLRKK